MPWIAIGLTVLLGAVFAQQPVINSAVNKVLGSPISATVFSVSITLLCAVLLLPVTGANFRPQLLSSLPWWSVLGGIIGVGIVAGNAVQAMARQPEVAGMLRTTMFLGIAFTEALALIGFVLFFLG